MAALLGPDGKPFRNSTLTQRVAEPGVTSVRRAWGSGTATGLTPARLSAILASAAEGDATDYLTLAEEMEERDPHYASVLGIRKRAISGVVPIVKPASDSALDKKIAEDVKANLAEHDDFPDLVENMLDALGKGFSQVELIWGRGKRSWWIDEFVHRDSRFFRFDRETGRQVRLIDEENPTDGLELDPWKWISHTANLKSGLPIRGGLARLVAFGWMCKSYTVKDWMAFVETYGLPLRLGRYGKSATVEDVEQLFLAVANIGTDAAAVLPDSMRIDFEQISAGPGNDIFENFARWSDEQTSKAVLGQTMSSDNGSSKAQAEVHNEVRHDVAKADARGVSGSLNRDLVKPYVAFNYGVQERYPRIVLVVEEAEDLDMVLQNTERLVKLGLKVKASEVRGKLGYSEPDKDDEVIGTSAPAARVNLQARNRAEASAERDPYDDLSDIEDELDSDWEEVMEDAAGPVIRRLEAATSYEEALEVIKAAPPEMGSSKMIEALVKAAFKARAFGDGSDG